MCVGEQVEAKEGRAENPDGEALGRLVGSSDGARVPGSGKTSKYDAD